MIIGKSRASAALDDILNTITKKRYAWYPVQLTNGQWILFETYYEKSNEFYPFNYSLAMREATPRLRPLDDKYRKPDRMLHFPESWKLEDTDIKAWVDKRKNECR